MAGTNRFSGFAELDLSFPLTLNIHPILHLDISVINSVMKLQLKSIWLTNSKKWELNHVTSLTGRKRSHSSHQIKVKNNHECFPPPSGFLLLILIRKFTRFALLFSDKVWLLLLLLNLYCCCCLSRSCVLMWLVHWRLYATTGVVTALYYTISKKIISFFVPQAIHERLVQLSKIIDKWSLKNSKKTSSSLMQSQKS